VIKMTDSTSSRPDGTLLHQAITQDIASLLSLHQPWRHLTNDNATKSVGIITNNDGRRKQQRHKNNTGSRFIALSSFQSKVWVLVLGVFCIINVNTVKYFRSMNSIQRNLIFFEAKSISYSEEEVIGVTKAPSSLMGPEEEATGKWSDVKLVIYMTTHLSQSHLSFLPCWNDAIHRLEIFRYADLILYTPNTFDPVPTRVLQNLPFRNNIIVKYYNNTGYQDGAIQAMIDPFLVENNDNNNESGNSTSWFDGYDWVIRLNPDVLIRNDTWLIQTMMDESIDAILHDCYNRILYPPIQRKIPPPQRLPKFHTDFTAFRPNAIDRELVLSTPLATFDAVKNRTTTNAEMHLTMSLWNIYQSKRFVYVNGGKNSIPGHCRLEGVDSPILHVHEIAQFCPYYYNATNAGIY
jgi:hypothetical protein